MGTALMVAATGCPGLDALNPLCQVATTVGGIGSTVATAGVDAVLSGISQWVAGGAEWLLSQIGSVLLSTTTVDVGASWFRLHYGVMTALAGVVVLPLLVVSTLQAIYKQNAGQLLRSFFVQLPLALLLGVVAIQIVILCLSATDAMCAAVAGGSDSAVASLLSGLTKGLVVSTGNPAMATFVLLLVGLLVAVAAFILWLELLVRAAAVYVAVLFLPMALATLVWPSIAHWCRRLVETLASLILSKFVIVATLSLAASAVSSGTAGTGDDGSGFASVLAGGALLVLSTLVPFAILRLIPMAEAGAISHLEGARQRGMAPVHRMARSAASFAMAEGMAAYGAKKLVSEAGPAGTGGAVAVAGRGAGSAGGSGGAAVGSGGAGAAGSADGSSTGGASAEETRANGGLTPDENGMMMGNPASEITLARAQARDRTVLRPRGPKPVMGAGGSDGGGGGGGGGDGSWPGGVDPARYLGRAQPGHLQHYLGHNESGPFIGYIPEEDMPGGSAGSAGSPGSGGEGS